ncbi:MAG: S8 family serine peptidase, partial [Rhodospirillales bacterium]|nr:S8 family serine peptidase [Rhodospirillales bacterium]
ASIEVDWGFGQADDAAIDTAQSSAQIGLTAFRADARFAGIDGSGYNIVIIDTGINATHPYFAGRITYSYDFSGANDADAKDFNGHGSNVSSIAAGSTGVASGAGIIHLKVFADNSGTAFYTDVEEALQWVAANAAAYNIASVNLSLGAGVNYSGATTHWILGNEFQALANLGVVTVASAGNSFYSYQTQGVSDLGADPNVLAVGAVYDGNVGGFSYGDGAIAYTTSVDQITPFSQRHTTLVDIFAPGAPITGAGASGSGTTTMHGTSQASPHIAGMVALAQELAVQTIGRKLTVAEFTSLLKSTGLGIYDGDNENDNVANTQTSYKRADIMALGQAILALPVVPDQIVGTSGDDVLAGASRPVWIQGLGGNDTLTGTSMADTLDGGDGNDRLYALGGNDTLIGSDGDDWLYGDTGTDRLVGGLGDDTYYVDLAGDVIVESAGQGVADRMVVTFDQATIAANVEILELGGTGNLTAWGSSGKDTLIGNAGNNALIGNGGDDTLIGGAGNDSYAVYGAGDAVIEQADGGADWVGSYLASYTLAANVEIGSIGLPGGARLDGNGLDNTLYGSAGNDTFQGGAGNDTVVGNAGTDTAVYAGARSNFQVSQAANGDVTVRDLVAGEGVDLLQGLEWFVFAGQGHSLADLFAPPVVSAANATVTAGQSVALSSLISVSDPNGDAIARYRFADGSDAAASGYFTINGTRLAANTLADITAAEFAQVNFVGGSAAGTDTVAVAAFDGSVWGDYKVFTVTTAPAQANQAPVVSASDAAIGAGQSVALSSLISVSDPNGDTITAYRFADGGVAAGSGHFTINGATLAANTLAEISAAQFAQVSFVGGSVAGADTVAISAFDGAAWSDYKVFTMTTTAGVATAPNAPPTVSASDASVASGQSVALSSLISVSDPNSDAITAYRFADGGAAQGSGHFTINGTPLAANTLAEITAAEFAQVNFVGGSAAGPDTVAVAAFDGTAWSDYKVFTMTTTAPGGNQVPMSSASPLVGTAGDDALVGLAGDDVLAGGAGDDTITGGGGADRIRYALGDGHDRITDFSLALGDVLDLSGMGAIGVTGYDALQPFMSQDSADLLIAFDPGNSIRLLNVSLPDVNASAFTFA